MKLAYSVGTPDTKGSLMAFTGNFEKNVADIKAIGYDALDLFVRDPKDMDSAAVGRVIERSGLAVAAVGTNPAMSQEGLTLLNPDAEIRRAAVERVKSMVDFAAAYGAPVCIGKYRGQLWKGAEEMAMRELKNAFGDICNHARKKNIRIMLEPQNKYNINNLNTTREAVAWLEENGFDNANILYDTFHGDLNELSVVHGILAAKGRIGFVHASDHDRLPPGTGRINFIDALGALNVTGYDGYISVEINQKPDSFTVAEISYKTIRFIIDNMIGYKPA